MGTKSVSGTFFGGNRVCSSAFLELERSLERYLHVWLGADNNESEQFDRFSSTVPPFYPAICF